MTPQQARRIAHIIVRLRKLMVRGLIFRLSGDVAGDEITKAEFRAVSALVPLAVQVNAGLHHRVREPAERKIEREGILAQVEWASHG